MPKIKYIIWDWNGTLVNDAWLFVELMNEELSIRNLPLISIADYREKFTFPVKTYYENLGFDFSNEDFKAVGLNFIQNFKKRNREPYLYQNAQHILKKLAAANIGQSIVSAQENQLLNNTVRFYQLNKFFDHVAGIDHYYADNKIKLAKSIREKINHHDNEIMFIGDTVHDYEVAQALNLHCILFTNGHYSKRRLAKCKCMMVDDHLDLLSVLDSSISG